jgi:ZipA, C-terminal FtsZ-binding domain
MSWWKKLIGQSKSRADQMAQSINPNLVLSTGSETQARVEDVLPGTADIPIVLALIQPPVDQALLEDARSGDARSLAAFEMEWIARKPIPVQVLKAALTQEVREKFGYPSFSVRLASGRTTALFGTEITDDGVALMAEWGLGDIDETTPQLIRAHYDALAVWLESRPEQFVPTAFDDATLAMHWAASQAIIAVAPRSVSIVASPRVRPMDGKRVWTTLHSMGIRWGEMDQFQWPDDSGVSDYLFWAEVDDGEIGYALPERIATGQQHFTTVRFTFDIARSPAPAHVLGQMVRAAEAFATSCNCTLGCFVDATYVDSPAELHAAVDEVLAKFTALGVRAGSSIVCRLR